MNLTYPSLTGTTEIYLDCLNAIVGDKRESLLDLCCNKAPHTPKLGFKKKKFVDVLHCDLDFKEEQVNFVQMDVLDIPLDEHYDVCICADGIEHLAKLDGFALINKMIDVSDRQVLFTPLGKMWVGTDNHPHTHKSGWEPKDAPVFASIVFPHYHKEWGFGAFFFWLCKDIEKDFERVKQELSTKAWAQ